MNDSHFLYRCARQILKDYQTDLSHLCLVFPNKRSITFFRKYLSDQLANPVWAPRMLTITDWVTSSNPLHLADHEWQLFELYEAYLSCMPEADRLSLERFYPLGDILLKDFADLDMYLVNPHDLYKYLEDVEQIEKAFQYLDESQQAYLKGFWQSFSSQHLSDQKDKFIRLWQHLPGIYDRWIQRLADQDSSTIEQAYRKLVEMPERLDALTAPYTKTIFIGFHALSTSEQRIFLRLQEEEKGLFCWDTDAYYGSKESPQEAGYHNRINILGLGLHQYLSEIPSHFTDTGQQMQVLSAAGFSAQAKSIHQWLDPILKAGTPPESIALVLADEHLLIPVLLSLPEALSQVNVTMGYPLAQSQVHSLIELWLGIQEDLQQGKGDTVYYRLVRSFLQHPLSCVSIHEARTLETLLENQGLVRIPRRELVLQTALAPLFFEPAEPGYKGLSQLERLLLKVLEIRDQENRLEALESALIQKSWNVLKRLKDLCQRYNHPYSSSFVRKLLQKALIAQHVPLEGDPLKGIQIMGLMESRNLDFEYVAVFGCNEGQLPKSGMLSTFIPDNIRKGFKLPVSESRDAIQAYLFYRLLHTPKHMQFIYNSILDENNTGEPSRYLAQLAYESPWTFQHIQLETQIRAQAREVISVTKTTQVMEALKRRINAHKGISATALNQYLECRLRFYFRYVAGMEEQREPSETVDPALFGTLFHSSMQALYASQLKEEPGKPVTQVWLDRARTRMDEYLNLAFAKEFKTDLGKPFPFQGNLLVIREVIRGYMDMVLKVDEGRLPFQIVDLENSKDVSALFQVAPHLDIKLYGILDRVDLKDGLYRIVDYKTGKDESGFQSVEGLFSRDMGMNNKAVLQTLFYSWIFSKKYPDRTRFEPVLYILRKMYESTYQPLLLERGSGKLLDEEQLPDMLNRFEEGFTEVMQEMFQPDIPFDQTEDEAKCSTCPYNVLCRRS